MRWAQLTLVEDDPGRYDPDFWLDYFRRVKADGVCLSAGGCVAYYPTAVPLHHRSAWMGDGDPFGYLVEGCRKMGMTVLARTDPHAFHQEVREAHPDWVAVDSSGSPRRHWASPEMWVACTVGPYGFDFMTEVHREIVSRYRVDGVFVNRWAGSGTCYCEHCRRAFREAEGLDLPAEEEIRDTVNWHDPRWRALLVREERRLFELWRTWDDAIREINPAARLIPNTGGGALSHLDMRETGARSDMLVADRQARRGLAAPWENGKNGKEYRSTMGGKPVAGLFSVGLEEPYRWKDSVQSEAEIRIWVAEGVANGLRPWFCKFSGFLHDRRWLKPLEDLYLRYSSMEKYLKGGSPAARVAMVYSQQTARFYGGREARRKVEEHALGFYQALVEARVPFEMVHDGTLDPEKTGRFGLLILPNIAAMSLVQCGQIREFVRRGGNLIATYETSLYDERGLRRSDFGLADLFGVSCRSAAEGPQQNSYLKVMADPAAGGFHPLSSGLEGAGRIINAVNGIGVAVRDDSAAVPFRVVPSYPDLPMEKVYPREEASRPGIVARRAGAGRVVYVPSDLDRTFWEVQCVDHGRLLRNSIDWALGEEPDVRVDGPGLLDVTCWENPAWMAVHMVNLTNPMTMKGPYRELVPLAGQRVRIRVPRGRRAARARFLVAGVDVPVTGCPEELAADVPAISDHEILAVDLEG